MWGDRFLVLHLAGQRSRGWREGNGYNQVTAKRLVVGEAVSKGDAVGGEVREVKQVPRSGRPSYHIKTFVLL